MALINCPECNQPISDEALNCPHCQALLVIEDPSINETQINKILSKNGKIKTNDKKRRIYRIIALMFLITGAILLFFAIRSVIKITSGLGTKAENIPGFDVFFTGFSFFLFGGIYLLISLINNHSNKLGVKIIKKTLFTLYTIGIVATLFIMSLLLFNKNVNNLEDVSALIVKPSPIFINKTELKDIQVYLDENEKDPEHTLVYNFESLELSSNHISSSLAVRNEKGNKSIYLRFNQSIVDNESLENFIKYSQPRSTGISMTLNGAGSVSASDKVFRENAKILFSSYDNGILTGTFVSKISYSYV